MFISLSAQGVSREDALAYAEWLEKEGKDNTESRIKTPLDVVYLANDGKAVECMPYLDLTRTGDVWGIKIDYVLWCRLEDKGSVASLEQVLHATSQPSHLPPLNATQMQETVYRLSKGRKSGFFATTGSLYLDCHVPSESDLLNCYREIMAFNEMITLFKSHGIIADYWKEGNLLCVSSYGDEQLKLVNPVSTHSNDLAPNGRYTLRPVHLITENDVLFSKHR